MYLIRSQNPNGKVDFRVEPNAFATAAVLHPTVAGAGFVVTAWEISDGGEGNNPTLRQVNFNAVNAGLPSDEKDLIAAQSARNVRKRNEQASAAAQARNNPTPP